MMHIALLGGSGGFVFWFRPDAHRPLLLRHCIGACFEKTKIGFGTLSGFLMTLTLACAFILFYNGHINVGILWDNFLSLSRSDLTNITIIAIGDISFQGN
jgi:hypothetical protein